MNSIYIAAPLFLLKQVKMRADVLQLLGWNIVSTWHQGAPTVAEDQAILRAADASLATQIVAELEAADALFLIYGPPNDRKGHCVEAGIAIGRKIRVYCVPSGPDAMLPTPLLLHPSIVALTDQHMLPLPRREDAPA